MRSCILKIIINLAIGIGFFVSQHCAADHSTEVFKSIAQRLSYMEDVALYKAQQGLAIEDKKRESVVLENALANSQQRNLDRDAMALFFSAQISAAKAIQYRYRAEWLSQPQALARKPKDLKQIVRPQLLVLGNRIIDGIERRLKNEGPFTQEQLAQFLALVKVKHLSRADKKMLFNSLMKIRLAAH
ncbi:MAG: chorismate mutase [Kangiellaceae bacterium]|nr:chorismate mutase [Kangiellaceae bacterium]MCW9000782.1 chorismate mutase [Kangiellaceae bacterium]MCW9016585.1 chorismate mutase [Kangiellaceae bacterium]